MIETRVKMHLGRLHLVAEMKQSGFICLAGRNGSGKTTFLRAISGLLRPEEGFVRVDGADVSRLPVQSKGIVMVTPDSFFPRLDVESHLKWGARVKKLSLTEKQVEEVKRCLRIDFSGRVGNLSLGMKERVSLATVLLSSPKVILVDEAFSNLDDREACIARYRVLSRSKNIDVIFTTQDPDDSKSADHLYRMDEGRLTLVF